jgi:hypothetical protein
MIERSPAMTDTRINAPGAPTNPPHAAREGTAISDYHPAEPSPAAAPPEDTDPHPSDAGHPYAGDPNPHPDSAQGSALPHYLDIAPNPAIHTGAPPPRPDNADHGPGYSPG